MVKATKIDDTNLEDYLDEFSNYKGVKELNKKEAEIYKAELNKMSFDHIYKGIISKYNITRIDDKEVSIFTKSKEHEVIIDKYKLMDNVFDAYSNYYSDVMDALNSKKLNDGKTKIDVSEIQKGLVAVLEKNFTDQFAADVKLSEAEKPDFFAVHVPLYFEKYGDLVNAGFPGSEDSIMIEVISGTRYCRKLNQIFN